MATKVFISWSGGLSHKLADTIKQWLPGVLQFVKPYFTPSDIEKGAKWSSEILGELESSDIGIICLTKENLNKPWILFESGALSKNLKKSRVCTLLFGVENADLKGPLTVFQSTKFEKDDFKKLVKTINSAGEESKLDDSVLEQVFDMCWENLEKSVSEIITKHKIKDDSEDRTERDILEEVLELTRLSTRRRPSDSNINMPAFQDLVWVITELSFAADNDDMERVLKLINKIESPLEYICRNIGNTSFQFNRDRHVLFNRDRR